jgi:hypothetical protein
MSLNDGSNVNLSPEFRIDIGDEIKGAGFRFVIVFLGGVILDGAIFGFAQLLKLVR